MTKEVVHLTSAQNTGCDIGYFASQQNTTSPPPVGKDPGQDHLKGEMGQLAKRGGPAPSIVCIALKMGNQDKSNKTRGNF